MKPIEKITFLTLIMLLLLPFATLAGEDAQALTRLVLDSDARNLNSNPVTRIPLILIHGLHGTEAPENPIRTITGSTQHEREYFRWFMEFFYDNRLHRQYALYRFHYPSDRLPVRIIARGLRQWIDEFTKNGAMPDRPLVILAHSMGGLVAKSYMQEQFHTVGRATCLPGGERVERLITLATPHHGVPAANAEARIEEQTDNKTLPVILKIIDLLLWLKDPDACKQALNSAGLTRFMEQDPISKFLNFLSISQACQYVQADEPNRRDLRYDNHDARSIKYERRRESNDWLRGLNKSFEYHKKIIAYYGRVDTKDVFYRKLIRMKPINVLATFIHYYANGIIPKNDPDNPYGRDITFFGRSKDAQHSQLLFAGAMIKVLFELDNDGLVTIDSGAFQDERLWKDPIFLHGYDHLDMKDDKREKLNGDSQRPQLFALLKDDLQQIASSSQRESGAHVSLHKAPPVTTMFKFDVKTRFVEKNDFVSVKAGLLAFIEHADWAAVADIGEDYSIWLKNYRRTQHGNTITIDLLLQIRTPAMFTHGKNLIEQPLSISYDILELQNITDIQDHKLFRTIMKHLKAQSLCKALPIGDEIFETML